MKRLGCLAICMLLVISLAACGQNIAPDYTSSNNTPPITDYVAPQQEGIRNIIIVIGDGMGDAHIEASELNSGKNTVFHDWPRIHSNTNCLESDGTDATQTTDSAASATALATGQLTVLRRVGRDATGDTNLKNIMHYAMSYGKATGVITTDSVYGATPAGFSGHANDRGDSNTIMNSQIGSGINLFCASTASATTELKGMIVQSGYTYLTFETEIRKNMDTDKLYCQFQMGGSTPRVTLENVIPELLDYLDQDPDGFVVMIEQAHIDKYSHSNDLDGALKCVRMLDDGVIAILDWLDDRDDTAIIVTADHETGGLKKTVDDAGNVSFYYTSEDHTNMPVSIYTYGFSPNLAGRYLDESAGLVKNTVVFDLAYDILTNPLQN